MSKVVINPGDLIEITTDDIEHSHEGWSDKMPKPRKFRAIGVLVRTTKRTTYIRNVVSEDGAGFCTYILPTRSIRQIRPLRKGPKLRYRA